MKKLLLLTMLAALPLSVSAKEVPFTADPAKSKVLWEGKKIIGDGHVGELKLKSGKLNVLQEKIVGGEFVIDMTALVNTDLTNEGMNKKLVGHLKSDDFFSVDKHPTATLQIKKVEKQEGDKHLVSGDLTIKGIKKPISFPATVHMGKDMVHAVSTITVDRTLYNVRYNSLKFFSTIGDKAIEDNFTVKVDMTARK